MKNFALVIVLGFGIVFAQLSTAQAKDLYVGTSSATGMDCYLMTETVVKLWTIPNGKSYSARLKMVGRTVQYLDYEIKLFRNGYFFENSAGYSGQATEYDTPIEWNMCKYIGRNYI